MLVRQHAINMLVVICRGILYASVTNSLGKSGDRARAAVDLRLLMAVAWARLHGGAPSSHPHQERTGDEETVYLLLATYRHRERPASLTCCASVRRPRVS